MKAIKQKTENRGDDTKEKLRVFRSCECDKRTCQLVLASIRSCGGYATRKTRHADPPGADVIRG
jgi:hypothetical protein